MNRRQAELATLSSQKGGDPATQTHVDISQTTQLLKEKPLESKTPHNNLKKKYHNERQPRNGQ